MGDEFRAPEKRQNREITTREFAEVNLGQTDRIIAGILVAIMIALILWVGNATQNSQVEIGKLNEKLEAIKRDRDLSLIYIERRLDKLEQSLDRLEASDRRK